MKQFAPLSSSFMAISILGFIVAAFLFDKIPTWSFTLMIFFAVMFAASMVSMTYGPLEDEHLEVLAIHDVANRKQNKKKT